MPNKESSHEHELSPLFQHPPPPPPPSGRPSISNPADRPNSPVFSMHNVSLLLEHGNTTNDPLLSQSQGGEASLFETVLNIAKTCAGTGTIALPFAASQITCWMNVLCIVWIALWCLLCVQRLLSCLDLVLWIKQQQLYHSIPEPPKESSGLGEVAFYAYGTFGLDAVNGIFGILLFMICVAYLDACCGFLQGIPGLGGVHKIWIVVIPAILVALLSSGEDMQSLSKVSALGILLIFFAFGILIGRFGDFEEMTDNNWPTSQTTLNNFAQWYGTFVFGFGLVPLTYNFRAAMKKPQDMMVATTIGLAGTTFLYIFISVVVVLLFPYVQGDVLQLLPTNGILPTIVRLAMVGLVLTTAPLLVLPCGELLEDEVIFRNGRSPEGRYYWSIAIRISLCILAAFVTVFLPDFVYVLSFVGSCWCLLSFVVPPLFHLALISQIHRLLQETEINGIDNAISSKRISFKKKSAVTKRTENNQSYWVLSPRSYWIDISMLILGIGGTLSSSIYTFQGIFAADG